MGSRLAMENRTLHPRQTEAGWRFHYQFSTDVLNGIEGDQVLIERISFRWRGQLLAVDAPQSPLQLQGNGTVLLDGLARLVQWPTDAATDEILRDEPLTGIVAEVAYASPTGRENPFGNLRKMSSTSPPQYFFATDDAYEPTGQTGRQRYALPMTLVDESGSSFEFSCTGVKNFSGTALILCGTHVTQTTPGTPNLIQGKSYVTTFDDNDIDWSAAPTAPVDQC